MRTIRQRCPESTRQRLLDAAHREMYEHGFQAASLERILADTGLTKGALYHHFGTKQALGVAVVEEVIGARLRREWIEPVLHAPRPPHRTAAVHGAGAHYMYSCTDHQKIPRYPERRFGAGQRPV